jgi:hypothetical protein
MPTEIVRRASQISPRFGNSSINPMMIAALLAFALLHLISGVLLENSHASPTGSSSIQAMEDDAECSAGVKHLERSLPYD